MAVEKWIGGSGVGLTWATCISSNDLVSLPSSYAVMSSVGDITNGTALDIFADVSIRIGNYAVASPYYVGIYLYPLNEDGVTYGANNLIAGTQSSMPGGPPPTNYWVGNIVFPTSNSSDVVGMARGIVMPPGTFRFAITNNSGATISASNNVLKYRTYNRSVA